MSVKESLCELLGRMGVAQVEPAAEDKQLPPNWLCKTKSNYTNLLHTWVCPKFETNLKCKPPGNSWINEDNSTSLSYIFPHVIQANCHIFFQYKIQAGAKWGSNDRLWRRFARTGGEV